MRALALAAVLLLSSSSPVLGFYLPGVAPQDFKQVGFGGGTRVRSDALWSNCDPLHCLLTLHE